MDAKGRPASYVELYLAALGVEGFATPDGIEQDDVGDVLAVQLPTTTDGTAPVPGGPPGSWLHYPRPGADGTRAPAQVYGSSLVDTLGQEVPPGRRQPAPPPPDVQPPTGGRLYPVVTEPPQATQTSALSAAHDAIAAASDDQKGTWRQQSQELADYARTNANAPPEGTTAGAHLVQELFYRTLPELAGAMPHAPRGQDLLGWSGWCSTRTRFTSHRHSRPGWPSWPSRPWRAATCPRRRSGGWPASPAQLRRAMS